MPTPPLRTAARLASATTYPDEHEDGAAGAATDGEDRCDPGEDEADDEQTV